MYKFVLAARVTPHNGDILIARLAVTSSQIVTSRGVYRQIVKTRIGTAIHNALFISTLDPNQGINIERWFHYRATDRTNKDRIRIGFGIRNAKGNAERCCMDVDAIRSRFIQENLRRALEERDRVRAARALQAFRIYFQWFENRLPDFEKMTIAHQLARLEKVAVENHSDDRPLGSSRLSAR
jgi:hypothetical protein